jgi:peptidoglycan/xylan/chitin deacetylase (PgdA/CDA1 family)
MAELVRPDIIEGMTCRLRALVWAAVATAALSAPAPAADRSVAVTFDDLPGPSAALVSNDVAALREMTRKLLAAFREGTVPVVGFVNEGKLIVESDSPTDAAARKDVLRLWVDAGHELGNHTYSHHDLNTETLEWFEQDVVRGEPVTRALVAEKKQPLRYFRHPFLHVGLELQKRRAFEAFLAGRGYTVAPVTIDNDEYIYAAAYAAARRTGDTALAARLGEDYLRYMESVFAFIEGVSRDLLGREIPQVLLLHANALNADYFPRLAAMMRGRGYRYVSLDEALRDPAYAHADTYVGRWGISWLHHWEITEGRKRSPSPDPPEWVTKAYEATAR